MKASVDTGLRLQINSATTIKHELLLYTVSAVQHRDAALTEITKKDNPSKRLQTSISNKTPATVAVIRIGQGERKAKAPGPGDPSERKSAEK